MTESQTGPISERAVESLPNQIEVEEPEPGPEPGPEPEDWFRTFHHRYSLATSLTLILVVCSGLIGLTLVTVLNQIGADSDSESDSESESLGRFWINQVVKYTSIAVIQFLCGLAVHYRDIKVNYTRKIVHICYFVIPQLLDTELLEFDKNIYTELWNITVVFFLLLLMLKIIRQRSWIFQIMYMAIDRPEDRPFTTFWFMTQLAVALPIIGGFSVLFSKLGRANYVFIPLLILTLGDGLAEPVGTRWGYHKYTVKGLFVNRRYTRSYQGSLCVAFFSVVSVLVYYHEFSKAGITFTLSTLPICMTLTEAKSPHTWDNPLLLLVGYTLLVCSYYIGG
jgi:dolichol kinase